MGRVFLGVLAVLVLVVAVAITVIVAVILDRILVDVSADTSKVSLVHIQKLQSSNIPGILRYSYYSSKRSAEITILALSRQNIAMPC